MATVARFRKLLRFRLSTLLLTLAICAVLGTWLFDRHVLHGKLQAKAAEAKRAAPLHNVLIAATHHIHYYGNLGSWGLKEFERRTRGKLLVWLYLLAQVEPDETEAQEGSCLCCAGRILVLLNCSDLSEVRQLVRDASRVSVIKSPFLDPRDEWYDGLADFVRRALARLERSPIQPGRTWLEAVTRGDAELLKAASSQRIRQKLSDEQWHERLKRYQEALAVVSEDYKYNEFRFGASTAPAQEGEVTVFWKGRQLCSLAIIKEGKKWKIDE
jgi:hypothetical protein